jgi:hypothetical protein
MSARVGWSWYTKQAAGAARAVDHPLAGDVLTRAAKGVKRVVVTSSISAIGTADNEPADVEPILYLCIYLCNTCSGKQ